MPDDPPEIDPSTSRPLEPRNEDLATEPLLITLSAPAGNETQHEGAAASGAEPPLSFVSMEQAGDSIGRYRLVGRLGAGGFGVVWRAEQTEPIRREVALKVIKPGMDSQEIIARFEAERQALAMMDHPNIAAVLDAGTTPQRRPYFVMELVKGVPITDYCDAHRLGIRQRLELFISVCQAVQHAHQKAILHRDLKPPNILVTEVDGKAVPKVIDFGLAKALGASPEDALRGSLLQTQAGMIFGTPQYLSPEQAGADADLDTRSDIYTLGVILYELLTGGTPLPREALRKAAVDEVLRLIREAEPARPSSLKMPVTDAMRQTAAARGTDPGKLTHALRGDLDWIMLKALDKERERRYGSAAALAQDLERHLKNEPVEAGPPSATYRLRKLVRRNRLAFGAAAALLALLVAGIAVSTWQAVRAGRAEGLASRRLTEVQTANSENLRHLHDGSMADYAAALQLLDQKGRVSEGVAHLAPALDLEPSNRLAAMRLYGSIAFGALEGADGLRLVLSHQDVVYSASWSPDGARIVTASKDQTARVWDAATGKALGEPMRHEGVVDIFLIAPNGTRLSANWSPDGTRIVTACVDKTARVWDAVTGKALGEFMHHEGPVYSASWSPDGTRIVTASWDKTAQVWDAATGKALGGPMRHEDPVIFASWSPDGTRIVTASWDKTAQVWDATTGNALGGPMRHENTVSFANWSPDGTRILTMNYGKTVQVWEAATGKALGEPMRHEDDILSASWSPDGTRILTASWDKTARTWDAATGKALGEPMRHEGRVWSANWSPDGLRIVTAGEDKTARVWEAATGKTLGEPMCHEGQVYSASWSPDGTRIVTAGEDKTARVWEAATGKAWGEPIHEGRVWSANWSTDGTRITGSDDETAWVWEAATGKALGKPMRGNGAICSPDGTHIVTVSDHKTARVWDAATGKALGEPMRHEGGIYDARWSPDGTRIVTESDDKTAQVWDATTGKVVGEPMRHEGRVWSANWSPDGTRIATASDAKTVRVWEAATGKALGEPMRDDALVDFASWSPDGTRIVIASVVTTRDYQTARTWDAATGKALGEPMRHEGEIVSANWSPDGKRIVTASRDKTARVWEAATGKALEEPMRHEDHVWTANWSPDGERIVTTGEDHAARVWDAATGKVVGEPMRHEGRIYAANWSPDGVRIVTTGEDQTARLWELKSMFQLPAETPPWVRDWARAVAGWQFDVDGVMQPMPGSERIRILHTPHEGDDPWSKLARWVATDPSKRTIHPDSPHTCREIAERERDFGSKEGLESALRYDSTVPLARLLLAKFEENPQRAAFLRDYDLKRLPDDPALWARAVESLHEQKDDTRARHGIEKLAVLAPEQARTLKNKLGL